MYILDFQLRYTSEIQINGGSESQGLFACREGEIVFRYAFYFSLLIGSTFLPNQKR